VDSLQARGVHIVKVFGPNMVSGNASGVRSWLMKKTKKQAYLSFFIWKKE